MKGDLDSVKIKNFFSFKDRARKINDQDMEQEKILITYIIKNRSVYRHIKNFYKLQTCKIKTDLSVGKKNG